MSKFLLTSALLYFLFKKIPVSHVLESLYGADLSYIFLALMLQISMHFVNAVQFKIFADQQQMSFSALEILRVNLVSQFYGLVLPGELSAGLVKWHKLSHKNKMHTQAAACMVLARAIYTLSLAVLGIGFFLIERPYNSLPVLFSLILGLALSLIFYLSLINAPVFHFFEKLISALNPFSFPSFIRKKLTELRASLRQFHVIDPTDLNRALFLSVAGHLIGILSVYCIMQSLEINVPLISIVWIRAAVIFLQLLPISISGLGVREGAYVFLLGKYSVSSPDAVAISLIAFSLMVIIACIGGISEIREILFNKKRSKNEPPV